MRELERDSPANDPACRLSEGSLSAAIARTPEETLAIVGRGRLGTAFAQALSDHGRRVSGPHGRGYAGEDADAVLLCVPDREIAHAAGLIERGPLVGHCSGICPLAVVAPHEGFSLHPLMTAIAGRASFAGAGGAVAGTTQRARAFATSLAHQLGMRPFALADADRPVYHAAASIASNFLVTLEAAAERLAATAGLERELLVPLVRATVENWAAVGAERALTGPVARGDEETVSLQRAAVLERVPDLLPAFDALTEATRALGGQPVEAGAMA
jgi:predicted short-subunit dehydrogenase-like oxidoreductase (DUF2520 family)